MTKYQIILHRTDEGISASVPALPGCWSEGGTEEEALENIKDAISEYLAAKTMGHKLTKCREISSRHSPSNAFYSPPRHIPASASLGMRQSPRGDRLTVPTFGPSGTHERLNWFAKNRR
jgi:predicted RNase H-like HicB family nuclease